MSITVNDSCRRYHRDVFFGKVFRNSGNGMNVYMLSLSVQRRDTIGVISKSMNRHLDAHLPALTILLSIHLPTP